MVGCSIEIGCMCVLSEVCDVQYGVFFFFFFQAEDGIRDLVRSRGLGDVYKRQGAHSENCHCMVAAESIGRFDDLLNPFGDHCEVSLLSLIHI